ncbi:beta-1,4-glucuronyltransferase 1 isoform X1 [Hydra vulgaris]|uniref:beta-1,4-glucuronyltransferase 1 isoform X1 n=1 Tax=Hydra vulgaris TaxID=6087 RepID=UPI001F5F43C8|nr:beta-1,4-glucuronyltransferase 1 isoform X1 [Hydra vulgaris]
MKTLQRYVLFFVISICGIIAFGLILLRTKLKVINDGVLTRNILFQNLPESKDNRYKLWKNIWIPVYQPSAYDIGIATQCSINNLFYVADLVASWPGTISVAVFFEGSKLKEFEESLHFLLHCHKDVARRVSFHAVLPLSHPPFNNLLRLTEKKFLKCDKNVLNHGKKLNYDLKMLSYPVNLLRNTAISTLKTSHVLLIDIDIIPSPNLYYDVIKWLPQDLEALVIPIFEIKESQNVPLTKSDLLSLWQKNQVRPFYIELCKKCQELTDYQQWKRNDAMVSIFSINWSYPWEPFFISQKESFVFDERFEQYGFNRVSQICDFHLRGGKFKIYNNGFLLHKGFKVTSSFHPSKNVDHLRNKILYKKLKLELYSKRNGTRSC